MCSRTFISVPHIRLAINICRMLKSVLRYIELHRKTFQGGKKKRLSVQKQSQEKGVLFLLTEHNVPRKILLLIRNSSQHISRGVAVLQRIVTARGHVGQRAPHPGP